MSYNQQVHLMQLLG